MPVTLNIIESTTELGQEIVEVVLASSSTPGPAGPGVPTGGTDGQVLTKASATDYDTAWEDSAGGPGGGAPTDATYLVTAAHGDLSAEVVVGATPGGELGGTWASPTVDATHSGSSHAAVQAAAEATAAAALAAHVAADVIDGDTAGGVLSGTYPNPGFAADMATQAELDAHINDATDAHDASAVSVDSANLSGTAIHVQGSLEELDNLLDDHSARHEEGGADVLAITAGMVDAEASNDGQVLTSDGAGGAAWEDAAGGFAQAGCHAYRSTTFTHNSSGNYLSIDLDSEVYDTDGFHDGGGANPSRITVPSGLDGRYAVMATCRWDTDPGTSSFLRVLKNGTTVVVACQTFSGTPGARGMVSWVVDLSATDYVELQVFQLSGGNRDLDPLAETAAVALVVERLSS